MTLINILFFLSRRFSKLKFKRNPGQCPKSTPSYMKDIQSTGQDLLLTGPSLNATTVGLLGISPMNAESQRS